jgi:putative transposase
MPRRKRNWVKGGCYHITHRCLNKEFFIKFSKVRDVYCSELLEAQERFKLDILNYVITSNHIHLLVYCRDGEEIEKAIQYVHGRVAQRYNKHNGRSGAFWSDRYHTVLIESGRHLSKCMFYIDYNMLRCGAVLHPEEWKHSGFHELAGLRKRYRVINFPRLLKCLGYDPETDVEKFRSWYLKTINAKSEVFMERQSYWTEASIVGSKDWIDSVSEQAGIKRRTSIESIEENYLYNLNETDSPFTIKDSRGLYAVK